VLKSWYFSQTIPTNRVIQRSHWEYTLPCRQPQELTAIAPLGYHM
jgi:hypothetical protein